MKEWIKQPFQRCTITSAGHSGLPALSLGFPQLYHRSLIGHRLYHLAHGFIYYTLDDLGGMVPWRPPRVCDGETRLEYSHFGCGL
jgi:hypothetical protein